MLPIFVTADTMMVEVRANAFEHKVEKIWYVSGDFYQTTNKGNLQVTLYDKSGNIIKKWLIAQPLVFREPLTTDQQFHSEKQLEQAVYHLRLPVNEEMDRMTITPITTDVTARSSNHLMMDFRF